MQKVVVDPRFLRLGKPLPKKEAEILKLDVFRESPPVYKIALHSVDAIYGSRRLNYIMYVRVLGMDPSRLTAAVKQLGLHEGAGFIEGRAIKDLKYFYGCTNSQIMGNIISSLGSLVESEDAYAGDTFYSLVQYCSSGMNEYPIKYVKI